MSLVETLTLFVCAQIFIMLAGLYFFRKGSLEKLRSEVAGEVLQKFVDAQRPGTTLIIPAGFYSCSLKCKDGVSLVGEGTFY